HVRDNDLPFITDQLIDSLLLSLSSKELQSLENLFLKGEEVSSSSKNVTHFIETIFIFSSSLLPSLTYFYLNNCINIKLSELFISTLTTTNLQYLFCYHMSIEYLIHLVPALQKLKSIKIYYLYPSRPSPDNLESTFKNTSGYWQQRIVEFKHDTVLWSNTYGSFEFNVKPCLPPAS
ncbi:unnamed protein product, partial [Didymodactylos carnosus]